MTACLQTYYLYMMLSIAAPVPLIQRYTSDALRGTTRHCGVIFCFDSFPHLLGITGIPDPSGSM